MVRRCVDQVFVKLDRRCLLVGCVIVLCYLCSIRLFYIISAYYASSLKDGEHWPPSALEIAATDSD